jgi:ATPase subunit of ABC transporter with duplicated ATPase domains
MPLLTFDGVSAAAPDGTILFSGLTLALQREKLGLVGRNGCGKSTLLGLVADGAAPATGSIVRGARIGMLRQLPTDPDASLGEALGIDGDLARLERIDRGAAVGRDLELADWTLPARLEKTLADVGHPALDLSRGIASLSGGERTRVMLAALLLPGPEVLLLDEPTNNLDSEGRAAVAALLERWPGGAIVASHDRDLLARMDRIVELTQSAVHVVGGGWKLFEEVRSAERKHAARALERSEAELTRARRAGQRERERQDQRDKRGRASAAKKSEPNIILGARRRRAEQTAARYRTVAEEVAQRAEDSLAEARKDVERVTPIRIDLPDSGLSTTHELVCARGIACSRNGRILFSDLDVSVRGPERIALRGANGSGKSSLVAILAGIRAPTAGVVRADRDRIAVLDQYLGLLAGGATLEQEIRRHNPHLGRQGAQAALAASGFRNRWAERRVASLSGGERVRLALACLFARATPPQMLILDEPTNHLDIAATEMLERALAGWDGAILCVSHDAAFLDAIGIWREITLA